YRAGKFHGSLWLRLPGPAMLVSWQTPAGSRDATAMHLVIREYHLWATLFFSSNHLRQHGE
ncbi:MAG: hypothetical protein ACK5PS_03265, partial [Desulfopila sp.]